MRNHAGGVWNHTFFWESLSPNGGGEASGAIGDAIAAKWGSFDAFKEEFSNKAALHFGSGWAWLVANGGELEIVGTPNQDTPLSAGKTPLLGVDVWEHAYYLKYQNRRPEYLAAIFSVLNWDAINKNFAAVR